MIVWLVLVALEAALNSIRIKALKGTGRQGLKHWIWFLPRLVVGGLFLWLMIRVGAVWYLMGMYMLVSHALFFPEILNMLRVPRKEFGYLGDPNPDAKNKSIYDKVLMKLFENQELWLLIRLVVFLLVTGLTIAYGGR